MGVNSLPKTVTRQRCGCDFNPSATAPESSMLTTRLLFNGSLSGTTLMSRYQKGKTNQDFTEARDSEWQWHQLGCMQVCTSLQTDNRANTPSLSFYRLDALPAAQPTASKHWSIHLLDNSQPAR